MTLGFWAGIGSRDEPGELAGASHFLEHLLFKGTAAAQRPADRGGGRRRRRRDERLHHPRAHRATTRACRLAELGFGLDLLTDVVGAPAFRPHRGRRRARGHPRGDPHERGHPRRRRPHPADGGRVPRPPARARDAGLRGHDPGHDPRRRSPPSTPSWYRPANLVVAAAGDLHHDQVVERGGRLPGRRGDRGSTRRAAPRRPGPSPWWWPTAPPSRPTWPWPGGACDHHDPDRYALAVANQVLGGGMSSRLFQEVREERGLAYTVFTSPAVLRRRRGGHALRRHRAGPCRPSCSRSSATPSTRCWPTASPTRSWRWPRATSRAPPCWASRTAAAAWAVWVPG